MKTKNLFLILITISFIILSVSLVSAQVYDITAAEDDLAALATTMAQIFGPNLGSISYVGEPIGYAITPHFEVGVGFGAAFVPLKEQDLALDFDLQGDVYFPVPALAVHGKYTIKRFELGLKLAGIPEISIDDKDLSARVNNVIVGGKVRYNLGSFKKLLVKGGFSVGGLYEYMKGDLAASNTDSFMVDANDDGTDDGELITAADIVTTWSSHTIGGEAQANFQLFFFNLYLGSRLSKSFGSAESSIEGDITLVDLTGLGDVAAGADVISILKKAEPDGIDTFIFGGLEAKVWFLVISTKASYNFNGDAFGGDVGVRLQF
jgi:hypothetical protein